MRETFTPDEIDLQIVNALQINPRAPWRLVGSVLDIDPATAARRWRRLAEAGAAWISCYPVFEPGNVVALLQLDCVHGFTPMVAARLAAVPRVMGVTIAAGGHDIQLEVVARNAHEMNSFVLDGLSGVDGIRAVRTHLGISIYRETSEWHLRALDPEGRRRLQVPPPRAGMGQAPDLVSAAERDVAALLARDPRISVQDLSVALNTSAATAKRRLDRILGRQRMLRCELARTLTSWPVDASFFVDCPADQVASSAQILSRLAEVRFVISTAGPHALYVSASLRSLGQLHDLEITLMRQAPQVRVVDQAIVMRPVKLAGRLVDEFGWGIGYVPIEL